MHRLRQIVAAAVLFVLLASPTATADPVELQSGFVEVTAGFFTLGGSFGIDMGFFGEGFTFVGEGSGDPQFLEGALCLTCPVPQTRSPIRVSFSPADVIDPSSNSSCPGCGYAGDLLFQVPSVILPGGAPFTMSGTLSGFLPGSQVPVFQLGVSGAGVMGASGEQIVFSFSDPAPIPEPGTLMLVGTVLAGGALRAKRRRTRSTPLP